MTPPPRLAWYGDDFTGASDTLATLAGAGLRALLFLGVPDAQRLAVAGPLDAVGIAGAARALGPAAMRAELAPVARFFASLHAPVWHYKCCSTFDSSPDVGSLGVALEVLRQHAPCAFLPILGGQPSLGRYCCFGHLFASAGSEVFRIDCHPTMRRHPVTPMHEADLRRHLAAQGVREIAIVDLRMLDGAEDAALDAALDARLAAAPDAVLFDVVRDVHLARIGRVVWERAGQAPVVALGSSSVAQALIAHWRRNSEVTPPPSGWPVAPARGPVFVLAGSQSPVTARQIRVALDASGRDASAFHGVEIDVATITRDGAELEALAATCAGRLDSGRSVLAHTSPAREDGPSAAATAAACARLLARVLELAPTVRRVGIAGGDTSTRAVQALGPWALEFAGTPAPGVALVRLRADDSRLEGVEVALKGGQMGPPDLFPRLLDGASIARQ